jgi:hypothetical protein
MYEEETSLQVFVKILIVGGPSPSEGPQKHDCRYLKTGVPPVTRKRRCAGSKVSGCAVNGSPSRNISRLGVAM